MQHSAFNSARFARNRPITPRPARARLAAAASIAAILALAAWSGAATLYILFKDDALKHLVGKQIAITRSYETQAAKLHAEIDRLRSLKLIDQERVDRALADLARRQTTIEARHTSILSLIEETAGPGGSPPVTGSLAAPEAPAFAPRPNTKPSPLSDTIVIGGRDERWAGLQSRPLPPLARAQNASVADSATEVRIANLAGELGIIEAIQSNALNEIEAAFDGRRRRVGKVLDELGVTAVRAATTRTPAAATGGPFLPWTRPADDPFGRQVQRIRLAAGAVHALEQEIVAIPVRRPTRGAAEVTSNYGMRLDPFLRQPALHTGIDFAGEPGDPVFAAAGGRVVQAERNGGYGLMVEIDHGNGLASRYAHLSAIAVRADSMVEPGTLIGRVGSTGRSTGPHLHYEVRQHGEATDPQRFLRAGLRLHQ